MDWLFIPFVFYVAALPGLNRRWQHCILKKKVQFIRPGETHEEEKPHTTAATAS